MSRPTYLLLMDMNGLDKFIDTLAQSGRFYLCVYSAAMLHNIQTGLEGMLSVPQQEQIKQTFGQEMTRKDPDGENEWDTIRDLKKIWAELTEFGPTDSIVLDSEERKLREHPRNGIVVPEYGPEQVSRKEKGTLKVLTTYLLCLAQRNPSDVREYMDENPFSDTWTDVNVHGTLSTSQTVDSISSAFELQDLDDRSVESGIDKSEIRDVRNFINGLSNQTRVHFESIDNLELVMKDSRSRFIAKATIRRGVRVEKAMGIVQFCEQIGIENMQLFFCSVDESVTVLNADGERSTDEKRDNE